MNTNSNAIQRTHDFELARLGRKSGINLGQNPHAEGKGPGAHPVTHQGAKIIGRRVRQGIQVQRSFKEHYKARLSHRLDEGRFTRALGTAARQTGRAIKASVKAAHAGGVTATQLTGRGMSRLGRYMATKPRQAFNRGLAATAAAGLVIGGYQLGKHISGPGTKASKPVLKGVPSGQSRKGPEVPEP